MAWEKESLTRDNSDSIAKSPNASVERNTTTHIENGSGVSKSPSRGEAPDGKEDSDSKKVCLHANTMKEASITKTLLVSYIALRAHAN